MAPLKSLIREIHRRSLWQVLGIYLAGSWVALQVVEQLTEAAGLPAWVRPFSLVLLVLGFPIVMATAFVQEGLGRFGRSEDAPEPSSASLRTGAPFTTGRPVSETEPGAAGPAKVAAGPPVTASEARPTGHGLFTWRNALLGGVLAFALLGLITAGYMLMRTLGIGPAGTLVAKGMIEEGERVILADFDNLTADSLLGEVVTEAFRVDLAQTPVVSLADPAYVAGVLTRMERTTDTRLDEELAREVAVREGIQAVIAGEVGTAGGAYVLSARVLASDSGEELVSLRETATDSSEIVSAVDDLSERLRERLGESLRSLRENEPLARVTTGSLEALRRYSQALTAINRGEGPRGNALLEEALEIDSTFAMAWRKLATRVSGERQVEAATKAYELRDRLTERERYHTIALYHVYVSRDFERATTAYRTLLDNHPDDFLALNNLSVNYLWMGDLERALDAATRARDAGYPGTDAFLRPVRWHYNLGRVEEARAAFARLARDRAEHPVTAREQWAMALLDGDLESARAAASRLVDHEVTGWSDAGRLFLAVQELSRGRVAAAREELESVRGLSEFERAFGRAWNVDLDVRGDTLGARRRVDAALGRTDVDSLDLSDRYDLVQFHARSGRPAAARALLNEIEAGLDSLERYFPWIPRGRMARGEILTAEGRHQDAIEELRSYARERGPICYDRCNAYELARAWDGAGEPDSAVAYYERYVDPDFYNRAFYLHRVPAVYRRLGELYDELGDLESAARYYAMFLEMWADADEELQPRVRAAQARLEEIVAERG